MAIELDLATKAARHQLAAIIDDEHFHSMVKHERLFEFLIRLAINEAQVSPEETWKTTAAVRPEMLQHVANGASFNQYPEPSTRVMLFRTGIRPLLWLTAPEEKLPTQEELDAARLALYQYIEETKDLKTRAEDPEFFASMVRRAIIECALDPKQLERNILGARAVQVTAADIMKWMESEQAPSLQDRRSFVTFTLSEVLRPIIRNR